MNNLLKSLIVVFPLLLANSSYSIMPPEEFARSGIAVGVIVEDLEKSLDFYIHVIGMTKVREFVVDSEKARRMGLSNGESFDIKVLKLIDSEDASEWKLMSFNRKAVHPPHKYVPKIMESGTSLYLSNR